MRRGERSRRGFTLLELMIAVTMLVTFLLPMILIISRCKVRAIRYSQQREVRDLAQRKLFDRIHYYEENDSGDFTEQGRPDWTWVIHPPEMIGNSEQVLLQYTIAVSTPQKLDGDSASTSSATASLAGFSDEPGSVFEMSVWTFPDSRWYEEQAILYEQGMYSPLYGDPTLGGIGY
jgi:prepilin-type N-terminal cleavage/methylation domain-containing protein